MKDLDYNDLKDITIILSYMQTICDGDNLKIVNKLDSKINKLLCDTKVRLG